MGVVIKKSSKAKKPAAKKPAKKVGDQFELPGAEGEVKFASIVEILPLSEEIRDWMKLPPGVQI